MIIPAQLSNKVTWPLGDLFREVHFLNSFQNECVYNHLIWASKGGAWGTIRSNTLEKVFQMHLYYEMFSTRNLSWCKPSCKKFKDQDSKRPEVHTETVTFIENDLRRNILWSPAERPGLLATLELLSKAKIHLRKDVWNQYRHTEFNQWILSEVSWLLLTNLTYPSVSSIRFSGFRSLYMMPLLWR